MRPFAISAAAIASATLLVACGTDDPKTNPNDAPDKGEVVLLAYSGVFQDNYEKAVIEPFEEKYPDIDVTYRPVGSSADNLAGLQAAAGSPDVDVSIMDISVADTANKSDLFQPLDPNRITSLSDLDDRARMPDDMGAAVTYDSLVMIYNDNVSPAPTTWDALWDPKHRGQVVVPAHPDIQGTGLMLIQEAKQGGDPTQGVDKGIARIADLAPSVQTWEPQPDQYTLVQSGNADLAIGWNARAQYYADESNGKLKVSIPDDDTIFQINTINWVKDNPNPEAAQTFIDYALSPEAQKSFTETMYYAPTNSKADADEDALSRTSADPKKIDNVLDVDWLYVAENRDAWTELWRRQILTQG